MANNLRDMIESQFDVRVRPVENPEIQTVDASELMLFRNNPRRVAFLVVNLSANILYIKPSRGVSATVGISLAPNGGTYVGKWDEEFHLVGYDWWCIGSGAGTTLYSLSLETY